MSSSRTLLSNALVLSALCSCSNDSGTTKHRVSADSGTQDPHSGDPTTRPDDDTGTPLGAGFELHTPVPCTTPLPRVQYAEVGAEMGLKGAAAPNNEHGHGGGLAVEDLDGDGDFDVVITHTKNPPVLYRRQGDVFQTETLPGPANSFLPSVADLDQDGDPDLAITGHYAPASLLTNDGTGSFELSSLPSEITDQPVMREFSVGDLNGDQLPDLFATVNRGVSPVHGGDRVLGGVGDLVFEQWQRLEPSTGTGRGFDSQWLDWDGDGDLDVYVVNDEGWTEGGNVLLRNDSGTLTEATDECACGLEIAGMGVDAADFNGDGLVDGGDFGTLLSLWGPCADCPEDLDGSGTIDGGDVGLFLSSWGPCE